MKYINNYINNKTWFIVNSYFTIKNKKYCKATVYKCYNKFCTKIVVIDMINLGKENEMIELKKVQVKYVMQWSQFLQCLINLEKVVYILV